MKKTSNCTVSATFIRKERGGFLSSGESGFRRTSFGYVAGNGSVFLWGKANLISGIRIYILCFQWASQVSCRAHDGPISEFYGGPPANASTWNIFDAKRSRVPPSKNWSKLFLITPDFFCSVRLPEDFVLLLDWLKIAVLRFFVSQHLFRRTPELGRFERVMLQR